MPDGTRGERDSPDLRRQLPDHRPVEVALGVTKDQKQSHGGERDPRHQYPFAPVQVAPFRAQVDREQHDLDRQCQGGQPRPLGQPARNADQADQGGEHHEVRKKLFRALWPRGKASRRSGTSRRDHDEPCRAIISDGAARSTLH